MKDRCEALARELLERVKYSGQHGWVYGRTDQILLPFGHPNPSSKPVERIGAVCGCGHHLSAVFREPEPAHPRA